MAVFFTSDTHFYHNSIIDYCKRPEVYGWMNKEERLQAMHTCIIRNYNAVVKKDDEVYHLGDFAFCGIQKAQVIFDQLNGLKYLIKGNHDDRKLHAKLGWEWVKDMYTLRVHDTYEDDTGEEKQFHRAIVLCHFPILSWDGMSHGAWHLHGHCHGSLFDSGVKRIDCGVDCNDMSPISYFDLKVKMALRDVKPVDHHGQPNSKPN